MFERFTDRARRSVLLAQEEARLHDDTEIGTEHLLLGLIGDLSVAGTVLEELDVTRSKVHALMDTGLGSPPGHIPFTARAKKVLTTADEVAIRIGSGYIGTEHILMAIPMVDGCMGACVLANILGDEGSASAIRHTVLDKLANYEDQTAPPRQSSKPISSMIVRVFAPDGTDGPWKSLVDEERPDLLAILKKTPDIASLNVRYTDGRVLEIRLVS